MSPPPISVILSYDGETLKCWRPQRGTKAELCQTRLAFPFSLPLSMSFALPPYGVFMRIRIHVTCRVLLTTSAIFSFFC